MPLPFHRRRLDPDAADFCRRSGATDRAAINAFVRGVKDLGLWNNMVCWPMRSTQNSGGADPTNTTVYSLGGLGTYNGTRVNGPTWGANGVTTTSAANSSVRTSTPNTLIFAKGTLAYVAKFETTYSAAYFHYWFPAVWQFIGFSGSSFLRPTLQGGSQNLLSTIDSNSPGVFEFKSFSFGAANIAANRNGSTTASTARTQFPSAPSTSHTLSNGDSTTSIGWVFAEELTNVQMVSLFTLYKTTLGTGLGLP